MAYTFQATTLITTGLLITNYNDNILLRITNILLITCDLRQIYQQNTTAINYKL